MIQANVLRDIIETKELETFSHWKPKFSWKHQDYLIDIEFRLYRYVYRSDKNDMIHAFWYDMSDCDNLCTKYIIASKIKEAGYRVTWDNDMKMICLRW